MDLVIDAFRFIAAYEGEIPGASVVNCGNFRLHDLAMAKWEAAQFVSRLEQAPCFAYPVAERIVTDKGAVFYDS